MARPRNKYSQSVGSHGCTVQVYERTAGGVLFLRYWDPSRSQPSRKGRGAPVKESLGHRDRVRALEQAKQRSADLLTAHDTEKRGQLSLLLALSHYQEGVSKHKSRAQAREDERRSALWRAVFGPDRDVATITFPELDSFVRNRRAGRVKVPGYKLKPNPSDRAIEADLVFLAAVLNHCTKLSGAGGGRLLATNPLRGYARPKNKNPKRPVATYDRFLTLRAHADSVDPQGLFGAFFELVEALGWRVSAICQLVASDFDSRRTELAPHGRLLKRAETDKEGVEKWVPLSEPARSALDSALSISRVVGRRYIFAAPKARHGTKPWSRFHARDLLERAEIAAGIEPGGGFHAYRRKWATERKHLPAADVAAAGQWRDLRSLERSYQHEDPATMLAVVSSPTRLRERVTGQ